MKPNPRALFVIVTFLGWLLLGSAGCSRSYKTGATITPADLAKALPEFPITLPPGGANLYLEREARGPLTNSWYKVSVPRVALTNFLHSFGFADDFTIATPQMLRIQRQVSLPAALDARNTVSWISDTPRQAQHAAEWDLHKAANPLRMYVVTGPEISSANDKVILLGYTQDFATNNATVYLEYHCLHR